MKYVIIILLSGILLEGCYNRKLNHEFDFTNSKSCLEYYDTIPISKLIEQYSYYWKTDSLGSNGYRRETVKYLRATKIYDVNYDYVLSEFGIGIRNHTYYKSDNEHLYLLYYTFNTFKMGKEFESARIADYLIFEFDTKSKKLLTIKVNAG